MRVIPYILYALLIGFHQVLLKDIVGIAEFTFNIPVLVVLWVALYKEETIAIWFGPWKGRSPVRASYIRTPRLKMSLR